jgi:6-methylsalicylic acid synthase
VEIVPAAVLLGTLLGAAGDGSPSGALAEVALRVPLRTADRREVQVLRDASGVQLLSRAADEPAAPWLTHTVATVLAAPATGLPDRLSDPAGPAEQIASHVDPADYPAPLAAAGLETVEVTDVTEHTRHTFTRLMYAILDRRAEFEAAAGTTLEEALGAAKAAQPDVMGVGCIVVVARKPE